ncbi:uncharacterized protein [Euwallacea fornicatus]|uniref:uncharacterized protein n=1 Tax=Euwallacea fornicatus TaxID=995702 RepID=UPI0033903D1B
MTKITELPLNSINQASNLSYIKNFSRRMLKTQIFVGTFQEKRFVQNLNSYRDVVKINSKETQFIENLLTVKDKVSRELADITWIGITEPNTIGAPMGYCLWVVLPVEVFGTYWFKVKSIDFVANEMCIKLEILRKFVVEKEEDSSSSTDRSSLSFNVVLNQVKFNLFRSFRELFTFANFKETVIFISLLVSTIVVGVVNLIKYLMEYVLQILPQISNLIKSITPIIVKCFDLIYKIVHGIFSLIVILVYSYKTPQQINHRPYYNSIQYREPLRENFRRRRGLPSRSSVIIEPLDD